LEIKYFNRENESVDIEKVYGDKAVEWLYKSTTGKMLSRLLVKRPISVLYGSLQGMSWSASKVQPFIKNFNIKIDEYVPTEGRSEADPYGSFNEFFIRRFKEGARPIEQSTELMPAFCEARYFGYDSLNDDVSLPIKGRYWKSEALLSNEKWNDVFTDGPCLLARLCPVDYHRFHFPDDGEIIDHYRVPGALHSVNPIALKEVPEVFCDNERQVTILETKNFGKLAYVEVGAIMVGKIVQSRAMSGACKRGEEKGYFLFGGSTVILLGEKGKWTPDPVVTEKTAQGMEVYQKLGSRIAQTKK